MQKLKNELNSNFKGITLVALVITIIVMLILVGVTINLSIKGNLFGTAREAAKGTEEKNDEEVLLSAVAGAIGSNGKLDFAKLDNSLPEGFIGRIGIYTSGNGNKFTVGEDGKITLIKDENKDKIEVSDLIMSTIESNTIYIYPNAEKYYPDLINEALLEYINENVGTSATNINEAKQMVIDLPDSPFAGKTPDDISNNDLVEVFGYTNQNDFMNTIGYMYLMNSQEYKREYLIENSKALSYALIISFSQDKPDELARAEKIKNMDINKYLEEYIIPNYDFLAGRTGESITPDELASLLKDNTLTSMTIEDYWKSDVLPYVNESSIELALLIKVRNFKTELVSSNNISGSYGSMFYLKSGENGTYKFNAYNDNYKTTKDIEVNGI